jgi:biopolymer transport protein ExbD
MSNLKPFKRRSRAFMLTPLVDVMFLLLIFFMVSSQTAPYSLLTVSEPAGTAAAPEPQQVTSAPTASREVLVSISSGYVRFNGQRVDMADLPQTIARYMAEGIQNAMILSTPSARVQDMVTVLEAFQDAHFAHARLMMQVPSTQ